MLDINYICQWATQGYIGNDLGHLHCGLGWHQDNTLRANEFYLIRAGTIHCAAEHRTTLANTVSVSPLKYPHFI